MVLIIHYSFYGSLNIFTYLYLIICGVIASIFEITLAVDYCYISTFNIVMVKSNCVICKTQKL